MTGKIVHIHERVAADVAARTSQQKPEGVSVMVVCNAHQLALVEQAAFILAAQQYPDTGLTGKVLYVGIDELGEDRHEVVLEVEC